MKKLLFAAMVATILFASCSKDNEAPDVSAPEPQTRITATFDSGSLSTRAFFDDSATPEPWENVIKNLRIYTFDEAGDWAATYEATAQEITSGTLNFAIPSRLSTEQVTFYAVANDYLQTKPSRSVMDAALDSYLNHYNSNSGTGDYTSALKYANGYTMSTKYTTVMPLYGVPKNVHFDLKRAVAKIAVRVKLHPHFFERYPGHSLILTYCGLNSFINQGTVMESDPEKTTFMSGSSYYSSETTLTTDDTVDFLFYAGASGKLAPEATQRPNIQLQGTLVAPNGSKKHVIITAPFNTANGNEVKRNGYYRLELGVTGIGGVDFTSDLTAGDWGGATTTNKEIGY